jgi:hypothetical protein
MHNIEKRPNGRFRKNLALKKCLQVEYDFQEPIHYHKIFNKILLQMVKQSNHAQTGSVTE